MDNNLVTDFLRNCANQIENGTASVELNVDAINFFCKSRLNISQIEQEELYRYISLGWYVYQHMNTLPDDLSENKKTVPSEPVNSSNKKI